MSDVGIRVIIAVEEGGGGCRIVGYFSRAFSIFCNFITMDMFSMGFSLVFELL